MILEIRKGSINTVKVAGKFTKESPTQAAKKRSSPLEALTNNFCGVFYKVPAQVNNAGKKETRQVFTEAPEGIPLERHRTAVIVRHIVLRMVHPDMMAVICFRRLTKERSEYPGQVMVQKIILFIKNTR